MNSKLTLSVTGASDPWTVLALAGEEAMSTPFSFRMAIQVPAAEVRDPETFATRELLAQPCVLTIDLEVSAADEHGTKRERIREAAADSAKQQRYGMISEARYLGTFGADHDAYARYDCTVVPRTHVLTLSKGTRIFQDKFVHEVVSSILTEHNLVHWWSLNNRQYAKRKYCTQYDETDWDFIVRLLAEEGIAFFYAHVPVGTTDGGDIAAGGELPKSHMSTAEILDVVATVGGIGGGVAGGSGGTLGTIGSALGLAAGFLAQPEQGIDAIEKAPGGSRSAGPTNSSISAPGGNSGVDVFCFVDDGKTQRAVYAGGPSSLSLAVRDATNLHAGAHEIFDLVPVWRATTSKVTQRDHDFRKPLLELIVTKTTDDPIDGTKDLEVYEPQGDYDPPYLTDQQVDARLEQLSADGYAVRAKCLCPRAQPGHVFSLDAGGGRPSSKAVISVRHVWVEPRSSDSERGSKSFEEYLAWTAVERPRVDVHAPSAADKGAANIRGATGYHNDIEFVDGETLYRPALPARRPRATCDTAVVSGPPGTEIYTDKLGRVKVKFHWDRKNNFDASTSCWLRVAQPWVGAGFGFQFIPRVGNEVLVSYVGGDPDRPVVTGSLYDAVHPFPEALPDHATRSVIRTQSSPGGGGFHEISFEDSAGAERLTMRSQGRLEQVAKGSHDLTVGEGHSVVVGGGHKLQVTEDQTVGVGGKQVTFVGEDHTQNVGGSSTSRVASLTTKVDDDSLHDVGGLSLQVTGSHAITVVGGDRSVSVKGNSLRHVGGGDSDSHETTFVEGNLVLNAKSSVTIQGLTTSGDGASKIRLVVGTSSLEIAHDTITLTAENLVLTGTGCTTLSGHGHTVKLNDDGGVVTASPATVTNKDGTSLKLDGSNATLKASGDAKTEAAAIKLKSGSGTALTDQAPGSQQTPTTQPNVKLEFTHHSFVVSGTTVSPPKKMPSIPAIVRYEDKRIDGLTVSDGILQFHVEDGVHEVEVSLLLDQASDNADLLSLYQEGPLVFRVILKDTIPAADDADGKRIRLQNLGYDTGDPEATVHLDDPDDPTRLATEKLLDQLDWRDNEHVDDDLKQRLQAMFGS